MDLLTLLADTGADLWASNSMGETPKDLALARGYPRLVEALDKRMATERGKTPSDAKGTSHARAAPSPPPQGAVPHSQDGAPSAGRHTRDTLRHLSYEQLIDLVLDMQAQLPAVP
mmetsp:Transcript_71/g.134  ORF Transcript_71/g.134 Transcript_71/m.134 type:complete len:115 (-) Transcript_71:85-429(-)